MNLKNFNTGPALFLIIYQTLFLLLFPIYLYYNSVSLSLSAISVVLLFLTGISITGGYHRFYSHRSYKVSKPVECVLLFFATMAAQGSVLRWAFDHRQHHAYVDTDRDPYSISKGFWYAHFLWILEKPKSIDPKVVPDLLVNPLVVFQDRFFGTLMVATNAIVTLFIGWLLNDYLGAFAVALFARLLALHHFTWFINSLAHTWGDKPFSQEQSAVNNFVIALLTFGEGYHNFHHTFANDYRNGIRWYHYDPTKWMIWILNKLGLASHLKSVDSAVIEKRMVIEHKRLLLERLANLWHVKREELELKIDSLANQIISKLSLASELKQRYQKFQKQCNDNEMLTEIRKELVHLQKSIQEDLSNWAALSRHILKLKT